MLVLLEVCAEGHRAREAGDGGTEGEAGVVPRSESRGVVGVAEAKIAGLTHRV